MILSLHYRMESAPASLEFLDRNRNWNLASLSRIVGHRPSGVIGQIRFNKGRQAIGKRINIKHLLSPIFNRLL